MTARLYSVLLVSTIYLLLSTGCVKVDYIDDRNLSTTHDATRIEPQSADIVLFVNESITLMPTYYNSNNSIEQVEFLFQSNDPSIATVTASGEVTGINRGQTRIQITHATHQADQLITVVDDSNAIARIVVNGSKAPLSPGQTREFSATVYNYKEEDISTQHQVTWKSSNTTIGSINEQGVFTAHQNGEVTIWAEVGSIRSGDCALSIGSNQRSATFSGLSGYNVSGSVVVEKVDNQHVRIVLGSDFSAQSGPGLYVYLSNQSQSVTGGIEAGKLQKTSGTQSYTVMAGLNDYDYVIIHCRPFNVPFGSSSKLN